MEIRSEIIALLYGLTGLLFVGIGIPLALQKVRPNPWYGFRTSKTLSDPHIWYAANQVTGIDLILAGAALTVGVLGLYVLRQTLLPSLPIAKWAFVLFVLSLTAAVGHSFWYLSRI
jgi:uncharacterized membrane protein